MTLSVNLPFAGFYNTKWSDLVDSAEEREIENLEEYAQSDPNYDCYQPEPEARLDASEIAELFMKHASYGLAYAAIARDYVEGLDRELGEILGFKQRFAFEEMTSPREYNFETDRLFATVPLEVVKAWVAISRRADHHATLAATFKERFTSYDGFHSHYDNTIPRKPLEDWDHNELGTLLIAVMTLRANGDDSGDEIGWAIYYPMAEGDYEYLDKAINWTALYADIKERQADKLEELRADDPDYVAPLPRCTDTVDMFTGRAG
jgi:hypothetical protein